ncbi:hypothetical protein [Streptomyces sp. ISL-100]|uniref:hypothetical protein n=1 Tax=Streptomyces sp. ISL-100 TaxID=2819173 RepID=UPI001BEA3E25|nr:hypothetical protein [Streptomyces sp. ISL-100]MBT2400171.1 hypothetical protein [Streptomyces sp. ISL-100]
MKTPFKALGATLLTGVLVACGSTEQAGQNTRTVTAAVPESPPRLPLSGILTAPSSGLAKGLTLPLDDYSLNSADQYAWQVAIQDRWQSCMAQYGFKDFGPPEPSIQAATAQAEADMGRRYGISDLESARKHGYHLPRTAPEPSHWEPAKGAEEAVFTGDGAEVTDGLYEGKRIPDGGCRGEAKRMFPMALTPHSAEAEARAYEKSMDDSDVTKVFEKWSTCMKGRGFKVGTPLIEHDDLGISLTTPTPSVEETALAVADVECKKKTDLVGVWHGKEKAWQQQELAKNAAGLEKEKKQKDRVAAKVAQAYKNES